MDAYLFLGVLHSLFPPIPGKLRDHLNLASQHGYQALKTTVQADEQRLRVEITTRKLTRFNESGVLAPGFNFHHENFRDLIRSFMEGESAFDTEAMRLASATIQVYTPEGEIGIINGRTRQLKTRLLDGDQVVVETSEKPGVLPKWLEWGVTPRARNSIRRYLRNKIKAS